MKCSLIFIPAWLVVYNLQAQLEIKAGVAFDPQSFASHVTPNPTSFIGGFGYGIPLFGKISLKPEVLYSQYKSLYVTNRQVREFQFPLMVNIRLSRKFDIHGGVIVDKQYLSDTTTHYGTNLYIALGTGFALHPRVRLQARYIPEPSFGTVQLALCYITRYFTSRKDN